MAGLDLAKAEAEVTIRVPGVTAAGRRRQETRTYGTTRGELESLADWLACWQVAKAGMEATGDYWKPVFFLLESRGFDCDLCNAGEVKALPGRPRSDRADSIWLARITERGPACSSFVPPAPIRRLRTRTRYRRHLTQARTAEKQRAVKLLEDGHLKLSSVISDIHGVSGRDMLDALAAGQRDPKTLAQLARGSMRGKIQPAGAGAGLLVLHALRYVAPGVLQDPAARSGSPWARRRPQERPRGACCGSWVCTSNPAPVAERGQHGGGGRARSRRSGAPSVRNDGL